METIQLPIEYSNAELAELLGCDEGNIRRIKSENASQLIEGVDWKKDGNATRWTEAGLKKLVEWVKTEKAIALRTNLPTQSEAKIKLHETQVKSEPAANTLDRYEDLPNVLGEAIANRLVDQGILERTNQLVVNKITQRMLNHQPELEMSVEKAFALLDAIAG
ncbi:hypothetical protein Syn7502_02855 [Synechococcus sp. PCC 7502]|uniref:hypothetical protein n=1 Tax=Synechococcus sp. PCC 7502 TaxID=1173263 RepID=UPI00029F9BE4|nr:hypothetical protein [Synechococcus sp. PCC 7502]AFY74791.1 hypothetical protein Syn7502_02855 [Synechococcus sp. PCC 7502]